MPHMRPLLRPHGPVSHLGTKVKCLLELKSDTIRLLKNDDYFPGSIPHFNGITLNGIKIVFVDGFWHLVMAL